MQGRIPLQHSGFKENLYQLELEYCKYYKRNSIQAERVRRNIEVLMLENCPEFNEWSQREIQSIFAIYGSINLSSQTLRRLVSVDVSELSDISATSFREAISYVSAIAGLDLSNVQEVKLDVYECAYTEGECVACNVSNHHIYYSPNSNQISSVDLLCHEIGHAVDFTNARNGSADEKALYRHQSLSEAVAYYCQFRYLQDHGNQVNRAGALGAFTYTYLAYLVCCCCLGRKVQLSQLDPFKAAEDELFQPFIAAYSSVSGAKSAKFFIAQKIQETKERFPDLGSLIFSELNSRLGIPLGLALLDIENLDLSTVSTKNVMAVELKQVIHAIDQKIINKLSNVDSLFTSFIE